MSYSSLPILDVKAEFLSGLKAGGATVVSAATGSGKSTQLPVWASEAGRVLVVQPRRVACTSLAAYVAAQLESSVGDTVGYAIRFEQRFNESSKIVFVTPGVALRWLVDRQIADFSTVILDEFHERRSDTDLLVSLLKHQGRHRLVVTSATLNVKPLCDYLDARLLQAKGRLFPVSVQHLAKDPRQMPTVDHLVERLAAVIKEKVFQHKGDVLVFLPGKVEINRLAEQLKRDQIYTVSLHGGIDQREQQQVLNTEPQQRVVLATNVAETSVTIPGITVVVDSGLERRTHQRNGRTVLALHSISKASAEQRKGRAGRVQEGVCYRLWGEHAPLELVTPPETQREELTELVLGAACAGVSVAGLPFPDALPEKSLTVALERLHRLGAIDDRLVATEYGQRIYPLPLDSFFSHLITAMPDASLKAAVIDLAAMLTTGGRLWRLPKGEVERLELQRWLPVNCDLRTAIALIRQGAPSMLDVDGQRLSDSRVLANQIRQVLGLPTMNSEIDFDFTALVKALINADPSLIFIRRAKRKQAMGNGRSEVQVSEDSRLTEDDEAALVFDQHSLAAKQGTRQTINIATCLAPVPVRLLAKLDVGDVEYLSPLVRDGRVLCQWQRCLAGRVIDSGEAEPEAAVLLPILAKLILSGQLLTGVGSQLQHDWQAWQLFKTLGLDDSAPAAVTTFLCVEDWLINQLAMLGIETTEDLALIDAPDLKFEGVPQWQRDDFDEKYPLSLSLSGGLKLSVEYKAAARQVLLQKVGGTRKDDPKRKELPVWQGWKIKYRKASRVVDIK